MTTRTRAVASATIFTLVYFLSLTGIMQSGLAGLVNFNSEFVLEITIGTILSILMLVLSAWTLFFKTRRGTFFNIMLFPAVTIFSYTVFSDTVVSTILGLAQVPATVILVIGGWLVSYLLLLTANVLNGAVLYNIPLGQAGKAAQFVFSLIGAYLLTAFSLGSDLPLAVKVGLIFTFVFYWSYSAIWQLQQLNGRAFLSALSIAITIGLTALILSVWPLATIFTTLVVVLFFYILLNVALENRHRIGGAFWVEYSVLLIAVLLILTAFAEWGTRGTII